MMQASIQAKRCYRCKTVYPSTPEYFHRDKNRYDGLYSYCKPCAHELSRKVTPVGKCHKLPQYDAGRVWRDMPCETCHKTTRHIFCLSRIETSKTVYACFTCGNEHNKAAS